MTQLNVRNIANENLQKVNPLLLPLPWLAVIVLVIVFVAMKYSGTSDTATDAQEKAKEFPQIFMTDVDMREFDKTGAVHYQLKTPSIRHYQIGEKMSDKDYTLVDSPNIVFFSGQQKPAWNITAQQGRSDNNGVLFTLTTDVLAQQTSETQGLITINTSELRVNTRDQFAETDKAVTMRAAPGIMSTLGMRADIKNDHIELLSKVKGTYEP
jgi:lipopolysaccharide export system protein LptC